MQGTNTTDTGKIAPEKDAITPSWPCVSGLSYDDCHAKHVWAECEGATMSYEAWLPVIEAFWTCQ